MAWFDKYRLRRGSHELERGEAKTSEASGRYLHETSTALLGPLGIVAVGAIGFFIADAATGNSEFQSLRQTAGRQPVGPNIGVNGQRRGATVGVVTSVAHDQNRFGTIHLPLIT